MWSFTNLSVFILSACAVSDCSKVFQKCCPKGQTLVKLTDSDEIISKDSFQCMESAFILNGKKITNPSSSLIVDDSVILEHGVPDACDLQIIELRNMEIQSNNKDTCYDRLSLEIINDTAQNVIPKTVALKCNDTESSSETLLYVTSIRKCCPGGQYYDTEYHLCRNVKGANVESFLELLTLKSADIYEIENGLNCKLEEYAVELKEEKFRFELHGSTLSVYKRDGKGESKVSKGNWCMDQEYSTRKLVARMCTRDCDHLGAFCMRKCCPVGEHYQPYRCGSPVSRCVPNIDDSVLFNLSYYLEPLIKESSVADVMGIRTQIFCESGKVALNNSLAMDRHSLTADGRLYWALGVRNDYCMEALDTRACNDEVQIMTVLCFAKRPNVKDFRMSFIFNCISAVCLALTLAVYCLLPELHNLHGLNIICHVSTMLLAYSCLARVQHMMVEDSSLCTLLGYGIYFGFVAAFAWLNVMCVDIWWTFGSVRTVQPLHKRSAGRRRFLWYSLYAWGVAISLTLVMYLLDRFPLTPVLDADIGNGMCWFGSLQNSKSDWPHYIFFVIPMGLVSVVNFILWVLTARHCARVKSEVHRLQAGSVGDRAKRRFRIDKANLALTGKLWVVMGAGWISELVATVFVTPEYEGSWIFTIIDMVNELQGVFIFIILVFKPKMYYLARKRLGCSRTPTDPRLEKGDAQKNGATSSGRTSSTFLSRTISSDERTNKRVSVPNDSSKIL